MDAGVGYGLALFGGRFTGTLHRRSALCASAKGPACIDPGLLTPPRTYTHPGAVAWTGERTKKWSCPASNLGKTSRLRVVNASGIETEVEIEGRDDAGSPGRAKMRFTLPADGARMLNAQNLERGDSGSEAEFEFDGSLGDGAGKWQLFVDADRPIQVMSLMLTSDGLLSNLSTASRDSVVRGSAGADELWGGNGDDVIDPGANEEGSDLAHGSLGDDRIVYSDSDDWTYNEVHYSRLDASPVRAVIDRRANRATVDKGPAGTDTIVDFVNSLNWGIALHGTRFDDNFAGARWVRGA